MGADNADTGRMQPSRSHATTARTILGRGGVGGRVVCWVGILLSVAFDVNTGLADNDGIWNVTGQLLGNAAVAALLVTLATVKIETVGVWLGLVGALSVTRIPACAIAAVDNQNGLRISVTDGRSWGHLGYGGSLIGAFTGNDRAQAMANSIEAWRQSLPESHGPVQATRRFRWSLIALWLSTIAATLVVCLGVHALRWQ